MSSSHPSARRSWRSQWSTPSRKWSSTRSYSLSTISALPHWWRPWSVKCWKSKWAWRSTKPQRMLSCKLMFWLPPSSWSLLNRYFTSKSLGIYQNLKFSKMQWVFYPARSKSWRTMTRAALTSFDAVPSKRKRRLTTQVQTMIRSQQSSCQKASTSWHCHFWQSQQTHGCTCTSRQTSRWSRTADFTCPVTLSSSRWWSARPTQSVLTVRTCASTLTACSHIQCASRMWYSLLRK